MPFVLMHISDPHFHRLPRRPGQYLSKRALGALNLVLRRRRQFPPERARRLVERLQREPWQHLLITGDLTQLGTPEEFALAREALAPLLARGPDQVTIIPGNHDRYVAEPPGQGAFEARFGEFTGRGRLHTRQLTEHWWLVTWDSAVPAPWRSAAGRVPPETLAATEAWLAGLPTGARVIIANHYPVFFPPPHHYRASHDLTNQDAVREWLLAHPVRLYLHGHIHQNWVLTMNGRHGPLTVVNSASSTQRPRPDDPSAFHRIVLDGPDFRIEPLRLE
ncbi:MAG TPA: metallophosphoesterase [bacterium]|nr:metallophosphoesterase [bacterium]